MTPPPQPAVPPPRRDHRQLHWNRQVEASVRRAVGGWLREDLGFEADWTSVALVPAAAVGSLSVVARRPGVIAGLPAAGLIVAEADAQLGWKPIVADGDRVEQGTVVAELAGPVRSILQVERVLLNLLGRLSGVATATRQLVDAVSGTGCRVYDTRKTLPGWRLLDKYAVGCGGGSTHRLGLYDAILIKDNHLAAAAVKGITPAEAVARARAFITASFPPARAATMVVEIEVDTLEQAEEILNAGRPETLPDIMLLDNMSLAVLREGVRLRDSLAADVILEASGGITLETAAAIAATGVDRISTGMPTHAATWLDIALDWP
jgi:nicotinate-nucleotide pyrophosphorylase (carboxylating)